MKSTLKSDVVQDTLAGGIGPNSGLCGRGDLDGIRKHFGSSAILH